MNAFHSSVLSLGGLALIVPLAAACGSQDLPQGITAPTSSAAQQASLSGQVSEITPAGRVPAGGVQVLAVVVTPSGCPAPCSTRRTWSSHSTGTDPDGRYTFAALPSGDVAVLVLGSSFRQLCGVGATLGPATQLDVEITSNANPQPSPTRPPLRVTGQIYEMTPAGRVGVSSAWVALDHHGPDSPLLTVFADADGRYSVCGIPPNWQVAFDVGQSGYVGRYDWHEFTGDATVDVELQRH